MKLLHLYIGNFRVLRNLTIDFDSAQRQVPPVTFDPSYDYTLGFLVGVNGTGKSTVLRVLAYLFSELEKPEPTIPFPLSSLQNSEH